MIVVYILGLGRFVILFYLSSLHCISILAQSFIILLLAATLSG